MAARLRSISKRIHWSLVLKAAVFALAWAWFPFWLFALVAIGLYAIPFFQGGGTRRLAIPFFVLIILCYLQPQGAVFAIIFGAVFYAILLIKNLLLIDSRSAYELVVLVLSFIVLRDFYKVSNEGVSGIALLYAILTAFCLAALLSSFVNGFKSDIVPAERGVRRIAVWLSFLLLVQVVMAALFLPVDFIYQAVTAFLAVILLVDLVPEYLTGALSKVKVLTAVTAVLVLFVIILGSARWGL